MSRKTKREKEEEKVIKKRMKGLLIILITSTILFAFYQIVKEKSFNENGVKTKAVVTNINHQTYVVEDGTPRINHYYISYSFFAEDKLFKSVYEVSNYHYDQYFTGAIKMNDSIDIIYLKSNPKKNEILKLED